jgi:predicted dehydrogenase
MHSFNTESIKSVLCQVFGITMQDHTKISANPALRSIYQAPGTQTPMTDLLNVAVIGTGYWGKHYVRILNSTNQCALAVDANQAALSKIEQNCPAMEGKTSTTLEDAVQIDNNIQALIVVTPAATHYQVVKAALLSGKHVLVEKPLTLNSNHATELIRLAQEKNLQLMVGHTFLFNSSVWHLDTILRDRVLFGDLRYISARRTNLGPVRNDCSVLWDLAPHDISIILALNHGSKPIHISCTGQSVLSNSIHIDVAFLTITFDNNTIAHIHVSWCDPHKVREITAIGSKMKVTFNDMDDHPITCFHQAANVDPQNQERNIFSDGAVVKPVVAASEPLNNQVVDFLGRCSGHGAGSSGAPKHMSSVNETIGSTVVQLLAAAEKSVENGGTPVDLLSNQGGV